MSDYEQDEQQERGDERTDHETILMALDQISQTIDVMTSVVGRLRHFVHEQGVAAESKAEREPGDAARDDHTLHCTGNTP
jgi:hypothetical protein